jgi:hypothetical protein
MILYSRHRIAGWDGIGISLGAQIQQDCANTSPEHAAFTAPMGERSSKQITIPKFEKLEIWAYNLRLG